MQFIMEFGQGRKMMMYEQESTHLRDLPRDPHPCSSRKEALDLCSHVFLVPITEGMYQRASFLVLHASEMTFFFPILALYHNEMSQYAF
jgi:hypothetical protein